MFDHLFHYLFFFQYDLFLFGENKRDSKQKCSAVDIAQLRRLLSKHFCFQLFFVKDFSFLTVCLIRWFRGVGPHGRQRRENFLKFRKILLK